jgi:hypothetical protein
MGPTASARTSGKQIATSGKIRTTCVRHLISPSVPTPVITDSAQTLLQNIPHHRRNQVICLLRCSDPWSEPVLKDPRQLHVSTSHTVAA